MFVLALCAFAWPAGRVYAQGTTTGAITGTVVNAQGAGVPGVSVLAVHVPSGTQYGALTRGDGRYIIPNVRVGGPYRISVSHIGYEAAPHENVTVTLGGATRVDFSLAESAVAVAGITVTGERQAAIISPDRTGAATTITRDAIAALPSVSGRIADIARLTPQSSGGLSFAGQDSRMNNITVDGSYFNNSFGLRSVPGETSGVAPISLSAIEQFQINIAPYDVRQGNFVGASVNTVTRSGTNNFRGSVDYRIRSNDFVGKTAGANKFNPGTFDFHNVGGWISGPILKNKLFFFANYEDESLTSPGTTFLANPGSVAPGGSITRVKASDLTTLSTFMKTNFGYETGPFQDYNFATPAKRFLAKLDYNLNEKNKVTLRYNLLNSSTDQLVSNSSSLGNGNRRTSTDALNFANSNYAILENIRSVVGEVNTVVGSHMSNNIIAGYTHQDESRGYKSDFFPFVDILEGGLTYTSLGFEPFTPNNELRYNTLQFQDNFTIFGNKHDLTFGLSAEKYNSENVFFQGAQSVYTYNSLADFYTDANAFLADPNCKTDALSAACRARTSPVTLKLFQVGYNNIPTNEKPLQPLEVVFGGVYGQDEFRVSDRLKLTAGIRVEAPFFSATGYPNANADKLTFRDENGKPVQYKTGDLPNANPLFSPRLGVNFDVLGDRTTQLRGGTGVFTGKPAYVWISNQVGNTGVLTGLRSATNTKAFPFNPNPGAYKPDPASLTGAPATSYALAVTDPDFKFPQVWRSDVGLDQKLPLGIVATGEFIYSRDVNGIYYINANLPAAQGNFTGADKRLRWTGPGGVLLSCNNPTPGPCQNRINNAAGNVVTNNIVLKNQSVGRSWNAALSLEKPFSNGLFLKAAYSYGESKNTVDPGSIAAGTWQNNPQSNDPNNPGVGFSANSPGHRLFATGSYRKQWFKFGATSLGLFWERRDIGNTQYIFASDMNGDGGTNDLIYIPKNPGEMNFVAIPAVAATNTPAFSVQQQKDAWEAYIKQDEYLNAHRGEYAKRGEVWLPTVQRADLSLGQEIFTNVYGKRNSIALRADVVNVGNLLNSNWGVGQRITSNQPLTNPGVDAAGAATYRLRVIGTGPTAKLINTTFEPTNSRADVYEVQFRIVYTFN
jgi:hypothetical protein